jgi:hypothetical protein
MKNYTILLLISLITIASCKVENEIKTNSQNDIKKFSFIKMNFNGDRIDENLSLYGEGAFHSFSSISEGSLVRRCHYYWSNEWERPCSNCNNDLKMFYFLWNTVTNQESLSDRIGHRFSIGGNLQESRMYIDFDYNGLSYTLNYSETDSLTYIDVKDTIIDGRDYELSHLLFDRLSFEDDSGNKTIVDDLELRQVLRRR